MKSKKLTSDGGPSYALIFERDDEVVTGLTDFAIRHDLHAAHFTAIGAFSYAVLAYFDWETKDYVKIPIHEQVEVLVLTGDIALKDDKPVVHAHVVVGRRDGTTRGGHLLSARVRPTLEVVLTTGGALEKRHDPESGLALIAAD